MRLEAHTKQLTKELKSARAALEQERKLRKVQSDTIKVRMLLVNIFCLTLIALHDSNEDLCKEETKFFVSVTSNYMDSSHKSIVKHLGP